MRASLLSRTLLVLPVMCPFCSTKARNMVASIGLLRPFLGQRLHRNIAFVLLSYPTPIFSLSVPSCAALEYDSLDQFQRKTNKEWRTFNRLVEAAPQHLREWEMFAACFDLDRDRLGFRYEHMAVRLSSLDGRCVVFHAPLVCANAFTAQLA